MDLYKAIRQLYEEKKRLDRIIANLEGLAETGARPGPPRRRGRKAMDARARKEVSQRMKRYWERRRQQAAKAAQPGQPQSTRAD